MDKLKKITSTLIVGAGVSGVVAAIKIKMNNPDQDVFLIEQSDTPLKKLPATGNGKCNINNTSNYNYEYNDSILEILQKYDYNYQSKFLSSLNIETYIKDNLVYPYSNSGKAVQNILINKMKELCIPVYLNTSILSYKYANTCYIVKTNSKLFKVDNIVFACGGKSTPVLGSNGTIFPLLKEHDYEIKRMLPGLCPIKVKNNFSILEGTRTRVNLTITSKNGNNFIEEGELLFKKNAISGIVSFNASRFIAHNQDDIKDISLDLLPSVSSSEINIYFKHNGFKNTLNAFIHPNLVKYFITNKLSIDNIKKFPVNYSSLSNFDVSQITVGGIKTDQLKSTLESKKENNIYFIGEMLDIDFPCGGYNLKWAFVSALLVADEITLVID